ECGHRFKSDRLVQLIDERCTRLSRIAVDDHRTVTTDFFKTVHIPCHRSCLLPFGVDRVPLAFHKTADHVHVLAVWDFKLFPITLCFLLFLTSYFKSDCFFTHYFLPLPSLFLE